MPIGILCTLLFVVLQEPRSLLQVVQVPATVRGQVTDKETGAPLPRALVIVETSRVDGTRVVRVARTDQDGRFEVRDLPSGFLQISATSGEHRATHIKEYYPPRGLGGGPSIMLKDGEVRSDVNIALPRAVAVSGRVTDDSGLPLAGLDIRLAPAGGGHLPHYVPIRSTDDRGLYRLFGVPPGEYVVCTVMRNRDPMSRYRAGPAVDRYVDTCHPSSLTEAGAQTITVGGADLEGIDIRMRRSRTFTIAGTIVDSTGMPATAAMVIFHRFVRDGSTAGGSPAPGGRFEFRNLVPGAYAVEATIGGDPFTWTGGTPAERGYVSVTIDADDVTDLVVGTRKSATVRGRVVFEDGPPAARRGEPLVVQAHPVTRSAGPQTPPARVDEDYLFTLKDFFGPARLSVHGVPAGWVVKSIRYNAEDITDGPAEFATDSGKQIEIVLTSRVANLTGTVTDDGGKPATGAMVFVLPADPKLASEELFRYRAYRTSGGGQFRTGGIRPGDYLVVALSLEQAEALTDQGPKVERLARHAERISLTENDKLTMSLRIVTLPDVK